MKRILINLHSKLKSSYFHFKNTRMQNLTNEEQLSLKSLKNDQSIIKCKPDKGQDDAILDKLDYVAKMEKIFSGKTAFMEVNKNNNVSNLKKIQNFLCRLTKNKNLDDTIYQEIRPRAASTPCLNGLSKLHKDNCPFRSILSATGSFSYQTASLLSNILKPLRKCSTVLEDSFEFVNQIKKIPNL